MVSGYSTIVLFQSGTQNSCCSLYLTQSNNNYTSRIRERMSYREESMHSTSTQWCSVLQSIQILNKQTMWGNENDQGQRWSSRAT